MHGMNLMYLIFGAALAVVFLAVAIDVIQGYVNDVQNESNHSEGRHARTTRGSGNRIHVLPTKHAQARSH